MNRVLQISNFCNQVFLGRCDITLHFNTLLTVYSCSSNRKVLQMLIYILRNACKRSTQFSMFNHCVSIPLAPSYTLMTCNISLKRKHHLRVPNTARCSSRRGPIWIVCFVPPLVSFEWCNPVASWVYLMKSTQCGRAISYHKNIN